VFSHFVLHYKQEPTLHIQNEETAKSAWEILKNLYNTQGFSSRFLLCNEFLAATPDNFKSLESYLNKVK